jgi:hypothetical protein
MSDPISNLSTQVRNQNIATAMDEIASKNNLNIPQVNHILKASTEKIQQEIKLPFALYSESAQNELRKRELIRKENQIKEVDKNSNGSMSMLKDLPLSPPKIKRRLRAIEKAYQKLFKRLGKIFKKRGKAK